MATLEHRLARATLVVLMLYLPLETWVSLPALWSPFYLVDVFGMVLMVAGARRSLRAGPSGDPGLLCAGYAWSGANAWLVFWLLIEQLRQGRLEVPPIQLWLVGIGLVLNLIALGLTLWLMTRRKEVAA